MLLFSHVFSCGKCMVEYTMHLLILKSLGVTLVKIKAFSDIEQRLLQALQCTLGEYTE